jgi:hypothetical protein
MNIDARALRPYAPLLVLLLTVGAGWMAFVRPRSVDEQRAASQLAGLRQREIALRREISGPPPRGVDGDPAAAFERALASGNASPALVEQLARLAAAARARNLLIETVEAGPATANARAQAESGGGALQRDPRLALFDVPVTRAPIRVAFDTDYASLGRFLWAFRNLPTVIEVRAVSIGVIPPDPGDEAGAQRTDILRVSLNLHAYSRSASSVALASNTVLR